jgi:hypothetical protein
VDRGGTGSCPCWSLVLTVLNLWVLLPEGFVGKIEIYLCNITKVDFLERDYYNLFS